MAEASTKSEWHDILWYSKADTDLLMAGPWTNRKKLGLENYFGDGSFGVVMFVVNRNDSQLPLTLANVFGEATHTSGDSDPQGWVGDGGTAGTNVLAQAPAELGKGACSVGVLRTVPTGFTENDFLGLSPRLAAEIHLSADDPLFAIDSNPIYVGGQGGTDQGESPSEPSFGWTQEIVSDFSGLRSFEPNEHRFWDHYSCFCSAISEEASAQYPGQAISYRRGYVIAAEVGAT